MTERLRLSNVYLQDANSLGQYVVDDKLITVVGELHDKQHSCVQDISWEIAQYFVDLSNRGRCANASQIFLEVNQGLDYTRISNGRTQQVGDLLVKEGKGALIRPFDRRAEFIGLENQQVLYDNEKVQQLPLLELLRLYVDPFFQKELKTDPATGQQLHAFTITRRLTPRSAQYLLTTYFPTIRRKFSNLQTQIQLARPGKNKGTPDKQIELIHELREAWKDVADYFLLQDLLDLDGGRCAMVLCGQRHAENLREILSKLGKTLIYQKEGREESCVRLYRLEQSSTNLGSDQLPRTFHDIRN